jgi:hypothetical protein
MKWLPGQAQTATVAAPRPFLQVIDDLR